MFKLSTNNVIMVLALNAVMIYIPIALFPAGDLLIRSHLLETVVSTVVHNETKGKENIDQSKVIHYFIFVFWQFYITYLIIPYASASYEIQ